MYQLLGRSMAEYPALRTVTAVPKPQDPATRQWADKLGMATIATWPPPYRPFKGKPPGYALWPRHLRGTDREANRKHLTEVFRRMMAEQYQKGNSITVCDDVYLLAVMLDLNEQLEEILTAGGGMNASAWLAGQKPSGTTGGGSVTSFAYNSPTHLFLGHDPDERNVKRFSEIGGVDPKLVAEVVKHLRIFQVNGKNVSEKLYIHKGGPWMAVIGLLSLKTPVFVYDGSMTKGTGRGRGSSPDGRVDLNGRVCTKCGKYKPWNDFYEKPKPPKQDRPWFIASRFSSQCKPCILATAAAHNKLTHRVKKARVMDAYGGKCACCGETELAFLTIDHVDGDGADHRRELGVKGVRYAWFIQNGFPKGFQVLCANCNFGRHINGGVCPHQTGL